ncbi:MAG: trypsin-like peptidase domain-containing protein [Acetobacteraceae bacterium]
MATSVVFQHVSGSKANQIERFPLDGFGEITVGRDPSSTIAFDAMRDDAVSRQHASIKVLPGEEPKFNISDLGSRNGTRVNGEKIAGEFELMPGDTVELGAGGPKFVFDLQPRPPHLMARTRVIGNMLGGSTRMTNATGTDQPAPGATGPVTTAAKPAVGRETVQRMLTEQRQATSKVWMYSLAGVLTLVGAVAGGLYYQYNREHQDVIAAVASTQTAIASRVEKQNASVDQRFGMSAQDIVHKYGNATVFIDVHWRLFDRETSKPLFHKTWPVAGRNLPCYVDLGNGTIVRWLTTEDEERTNIRIGGEGTGSGFVINDQGFMLTNKHVAAAWMINYSSQNEFSEGLLFKAQDKLLAPKDIQFVKFDPRSNQEQFQKLIAWKPDVGGNVFGSKQPLLLSRSARQFEGRNEVLDVRFPGSTLSIAARLVRASTVSDVAEIKVDTQQPLAAVELAADNAVSVGERVTVLGYPGSSVKTYALIKTMEAGASSQRLEVIPEPTVTEGLIGRLSSGEQQVGGLTTLGGMGDSYQLTVATGPGNSGGPVFNAAGKVIGLFTYGRPGFANVTFAVPIRFGRDLLQVQRN